MTDSRDVFFCHASEDKETVVRPLASTLKSCGLTYWLDEEEIRWGESVVEKVNRGLSSSKFVIIVLSSKSVGKPWPTRELNAVLSREASSAKVLLLPLLVGNVEEHGALLERIPLLADKRYIVWNGDPERVVEALLAHIEATDHTSNIPVEARESLEPKISDKDFLRITSAFFQRAFERSFPGVRGLKEFCDRGDILQRLGRLFENLEMPLPGLEAQYPIWYWRDGSAAIFRFEVIGDRLFMINHLELVISRIVAVNTGSYYRHFVYIESEPLPPTGLYGEESLKWKSEQYGLVDGKTLITLEEYDDGSALINGRLVDLDGSAEWRQRYLAPYNLVIAAQGNPINNSKFDHEFDGIMDDILIGKLSVDHLATRVAELRRVDV